MNISITEIADMVDGIVEGDKNLIITGPSRIEEGGKGTITFLNNSKYEPYIYTTKASAALVSKSFQAKRKLNMTLIKVDDISKSLLLLMEKFDDDNNHEDGISNLSSVHKTAIIGKNVHIGDFTKVCANANIGDDTILYDQVYIGENVVIEKKCIIYPGVKLMSKVLVGNNCIIHSNTVIGADGFGFSKGQDGAYKKIPQLGNVILEDNVEIGGNCVIDRATMGSTILRKGVKFDNLIHIAHNVDIGKNTAIAGQSGIAGSSKIGKNCMIGGQVGVVGHINIADGAQIQAKSGVAGNIKKKNSKMYGYPAIDYGDYLRAYAGFKQLPTLIKKIQELEKKIKK